MLQAKKILAQAHEISQNEDSDLDCDWAVLLGTRYMGFDRESILQMRYGQFIDYLITQTEMINTRKETKEAEKRGSVMDL